MKFSTGEHGFQHVSRIHCALRFSCANDGVDFVDEEDDSALRFDDFVEDCFEAFFKFAPKLGSCNKGTEIEGYDSLFFQAFGDVTCDDTAGEPFDDGGFADSGFADENRIVLRSAGEDLDGATNLLISADDRIEFALAGEAG